MSPLREVFFEEGLDVHGLGGVVGFDGGEEGGAALDVVVEAGGVIVALAMEPVAEHFR